MPAVANSLTVSESPSKPFQTQIYTLLISKPLGMKYQWAKNNNTGNNNNNNIT